MCTCPVVMRVSTATRLLGSWASIASRIESLIWSAILSGWPSVTDSEVKRRRGMAELLGRRQACASRANGPPRTLPGRDRPPRTSGGRGLPARRLGQARRQRRPDARSDGVLAALEHVGRLAVGAEDDD